MAFASGTFSLYSPGNPVVTGTTIASTWANNTLNDIATGLSTCLLKDGSQTVTANIPMSTFKFTGLGAGSAAGNSVRWEQSAVGVVTTAGDIIQATGSGAIARLGIGTAGGLLQVNSGATALAYLTLGALGTRLHSNGTAAEWQGTWFKVGSFTRDVSVATGTQAVTGVGFTPKAVLFLHGIAGGGSTWSSGYDDGTTAGCIYQSTTPTVFSSTSKSIFHDQTGGNTYQGALSAFGSDGFTVSWTKAGTPAATITIPYLALR